MLNKIHKINISQMNLKKASITGLIVICMLLNFTGNLFSQHNRIKVSVLPMQNRMPGEIKDPVAFWSEKYDVPRVNTVYFLKINLKNPQVEFFVKPTERNELAEGTLTLPDTLMKDSAILALMNANAFAEIRSIPDAPKKKGWYLGRKVDIQGLVVADGKQISPDQSDRVAFWLDNKEQPHVGHPKPNAKVNQAIADWFSPLLINGKVVVGKQDNDVSKLDEQDRKNAKIDLSLHPRTMIGFDDKGKWLLLVVVDGRQQNYSMGMSLQEEAELMRAKGCTQAINLDGGGSSIMMIRDLKNVTTLNRPSDGEHRPVPVMIGVRYRK
jgi:hypothetical protein